MSLYLDVSPQTEARFAAAAQQEGVEPAILFEKMVASYVPLAERSERELGDFGGRSLADLMQEIGFADGGQPDLSTNPKYMLGFGETKDQRTV
jgi:hypothetical protein